jgi:hypothetical protein
VPAWETSDWLVREHPTTQSSGPIAMHTALRRAIVEYSQVFALTELCMDMLTPK